MKGRRPKLILYSHQVRKQEWGTQVAHFYSVQDPIPWDDTVAHVQAGLLETHSETPQRCVLLMLILTLKSATLSGDLGTWIQGLGRVVDLNPGSTSWHLTGLGRWVLTLSQPLGAAVRRNEKFFIKFLA